MTIELILLMIVTMMITVSFFGEKGPPQVFKDSGPRLAARVERHLVTGRGFVILVNGRTAPGQFDPNPLAAPSNEFR
jgi:hypothetical protein